MSVSYELFDAIRSFDNSRRERQIEYTNTINGISKYKNSAGYEKEKKEASAKRKKADDETRKIAKGKINDCLKRMRDNIQKMPLVPPSQQQLAILQALSMKSKISRAELDRASNSMNGNSLALSVLNDLADKHYYVGSPEGQTHPNYLSMATDMSAEAIENHIRSVAKYCDEILESSAKRAALLGAKSNHALYGTPIDEDALPQRGEICSEMQFYRAVVPDSAYDSFMKAVNGQ